MQAFICFLMFTGRVNDGIPFEMQSEEASISAALEVTSKLPVNVFCISQFDGTVMWFSQGKQVERF